MVAPPDLAAELAARLGVDVIWFEESAHMPHEEEPVRFRQELRHFVSSASQQLRDASDSDTTRWQAGRAEKRAAWSSG